MYIHMYVYIYIYIHQRVFPAISRISVIFDRKITKCN